MPQNYTPTGSSRVYSIPDSADPTVVADWFKNVIDGIDALLAPKASPTLTGTPVAPTATPDTSSTQIATTGFVVGQASATTPAMDGSAAVGSASRFARADHVHPSDLSKADVISETITDYTLATNVLTMDLAVSNVAFIATAPTAAMTFNFTNVPTTNGKSITASIFVTQGATGYIPTTLQIAGAAQTIKWAGGTAPTPTSTAGKIDVFSFSMIRRGSAWTVLGSALANF